MNVWLEIFMPLISVVLTAIIGVVAARVSDWLNLKNEKLLRDALHQSAENGLRYALTNGAGPKSQEVIAAATRYVKNKNPETLKRLGVSDNALTDIIKTKAVARNE